MQTPEGLPISNAKVRVQVEQASGKSPARFQHTRTTDANGIARIGYPPAQDLVRLEISASHEDYGARKMGWEKQAGDNIPASYTLKLGNGITIGGRVVDEGDTPIAGASLSFWQVLVGWRGNRPPGRAVGLLDPLNQFGRARPMAGKRSARGLA